MASLWRAAKSAVGSTSDDATDGVQFWSNPERVGWLNKQGEYLPNWRRRWFVLKQGKLFWFKDSNVNRISHPRGVIPVSSCLTVKGAEDVLNKPYAFEISTRVDTMYFIADSEKEEWIMRRVLAVLMDIYSVRMWPSISRILIFIWPSHSPPFQLPSDN